MSNIEVSLWYVAHSIRNQTLVEFSEQQQAFVREMISKFPKVRSFNPISIA